jgi:hypothetical protein
MDDSSSVMSEELLLPNAENLVRDRRSHRELQKDIDEWMTEYTRSVHVRDVLIADSLLAQARP